MHNIKLSIAKIQDKTLATLILSMIVLPSGYLAGINIKLILLALYSTLFFLKKDNSHIKILINIIFYTPFLLAAVLYSYTQNNDITNITTETKLFFTYFLTLFIFCINIQKKDPHYLDLVIYNAIYSSTIYSTIKISIILLASINILNLDEVRLIIENNFSVTPMLLPISGALSRFQLANDYIIAFVLYGMLSFRELFSYISSLQFWLIISILTISVLISFSRHLMLCLSVSVVFYTFQYKKYQKEFRVIFISSIAMIFLTSLFFYTEIIDIISLRFDSPTNTESDDVRTIQINCLGSLFFESPIFGHGIGAFSTSCPAADESPYSYEVQYLGYFYKFGFLGFIIFTILYINSIKSLLITNRIDIRFITALFIITLTGLYNPYLISSYFTIILVFIGCLQAKHYLQHHNI
jgi:hypothetical protein